MAAVGQDVVNAEERDWAPCVAVAPHWTAPRSCVALTSVCGEEWGGIAAALAAGQNESRVNPRAQVTFKHYVNEFPIK